jgi:hypothetical protein
VIEIKTLDQQSLRAHLGGWPDDRNAGCIDWLCRLRGIETARVQLSRPPGAPPLEWLQFVVGSSRYLFRWSRLLRWHGGTGPMPWRNVNGTTPSLTTDKQRTKQRLSGLGYPVPSGRLFSASERTAVKPNDGSRGVHVYTGIDGLDAFERAFNSVASEHQDVLIEEEFAGESLRLLYLEPDVVAARLDRPASIVGDGVRTVEELIAVKNADREARTLSGQVSIEVDDELLRYLGKKGLKLSDVPADGTTVTLRGTSNVGTGGDVVICDDIHPSYVTSIQKMVRAFGGLRIAGVDIIVQDRQGPAHPDSYRILEINAAPGLVHFYFPWKGVPQDVGGVLLDKLAVNRW